MQPNLRSNKTLFTGIAISLLLLGAILIFSYRQIQKANNTSALIANSHKVLTAAGNLLNEVDAYEKNTIYFCISGQQRLLPAVEKAPATIKSEIALLKELATRNQLKPYHIDSLLFYSKALIHFNDSVVTVKKQEGVHTATSVLLSGYGNLYSDEIRRLLAQIQLVENLFISQKRANAASEIIMEKILSLVFAFIMLCLLVFLFWQENKKIIKRGQNNSIEELGLLWHQVNQSNDAIYTIGADFKIKTWNKGAEYLYGFNVTEAIGKNSHELLKTALTSEEILDALQQVNQKDYWAGELKRKTKSGSYIYVRSSTTSVRNDKGEITGYVAVSLDITGQKKLLEEINHLANIVEQSSEAIISIGLDQRIISWNKGAENLHGYTRQEAIGKTSAELGLIRIKNGEIQATINDLKEKGYWKSEMYFFNKNGTSFFGSVSANAIKNESGDTDSFLFIAKDLSVRKKLEEQLTITNEVLEQKVIERTEALEKNEKKYRYLFENNPLPMMVVETATLRFLDVNETAILHYGYSRAEFLSMTALDIRTEADKIVLLKVDRFKQNSSTTENIGVWRHVKKDGSKIQVEINIHQVNFEGKHAALVLINDVTEKIKIQQKLASSEKRYKALVENNEDIISILDKNMKAIYRSSSAARVTGWTNDEFAKVDSADYIHPDHLNYIQEIFKKTLANPGIAIPLLVQVRHKKGHYIWLEGIMNNLIQDTNVEGIITNVRDVTQRINTEEKLQFSEKRFRALIENNYDVITLLDNNFKVFYRSPSAQRITGWSDEEMFQSDGENKMSIHPDDRPKANVIMKECLANPGKPIYATYRNLHKNGHYIWLEGAVTNLLQDEYINAIVFNFRDITERVAAEDKLQSSEKRFRAMVENNKDVIMLLDETFKVTYRSPSATEVNGWTDEDVKTMSGVQNIHPEDGAYAGEIIDKIMVNPGQPYHVTFRNRHKNGEFRWLEGIVTNLLQDKNVNAILFNFRDITERIEAEEKIAESEVRFRSLIENNSDAIVLNDADSNILYQSPSVTRILGYTPEERKGKKVIDYIHPDNKTDFVNLYQSLKDLPNTPQLFQYRILHKNGSYIWLEGVVTNLLQNPAVKAYVANYRDISERKEAEETIKRSEKIYKTIASSIPGSIICLLNPEYRYLLIEGDITEQFGYSRIKMLGNRAPDVLLPEIFDLVKNDFERAFNGEIVTREHSRADYDTLTRFIPLKDENNAVYAIMTVTLDVTNLKDAQRGIIELNHSLEDKIIKRTEELKRSNEELEAFSYSVSHDLRAPLRAVIGYATILEEDYCNKLDDEAKRLTGIIKDNTVKMGNLIDGLLSFSRMGRHEIVKIKTDQNLLVKSIITDLENKGNEEKRTQWILHSLPAINAESYTIKQVWVNLISNAIKYSANTPAPIVEIGSFKKNGQTAFFVKDNGVGFDEKYKTKLFKVFQRLHSSSDFEGTGIGLAIVEKIINKHGGKVWVEAELNKGACFYFSLPDGQ